MSKMELKDKKVLLVGLGILGGGLSMAQYLLKKGAKVTITDLRTKAELEGMIKKLPATVKYCLRKHDKKDFETADIIIFNPAVPATSPWVKLAKKLKKEYFNDYTFFLTNIKETNPCALVIGITGTRGKTTTAMWTNHLIKDSVLGGNIPEANLLKIMNKKTNIFVLELSSFQLEHATKNSPAPNIAVLTNIYTDHLNRYGSFENYKKMKFKIFENQTKEDVLVLNLDEPITKEVLAQKPKSTLFFISKKKLPKTKNGLYFEGDDIYYQYKGEISKAATVKGLAPHEKNNLLATMLVAHLAGVDGKEIAANLKNLPQAKFRQQKVFENKNFTIINDSAGTSPDATIAAIEKFKGKNFVLISGGTNKELDFVELAKKIKKDVPLENLYLLEGTATNKLIAELKKINYIKGDFEAYENLDEILDIISAGYNKGTVVFSPGAASFGKFKNEFDRGDTFNKLAIKYFKE